MLGCLMESLRISGEALYEGTKTPEEIGVKALNDKTVEFTLTKPYGYFLDLLTGAKPVRQDKWEEWGSAYGASHDKVVMNGPFVIESWDQNVQMTLVGTSLIGTRKTSNCRRLNER